MGNFISYILIFFLILLIRYFSTAGLFYLYYLKTKESPNSSDIMSQRPLKKDQIRKEMYWSVLSSAIFAVFGALVY